MPVYEYKCDSCGSVFSELTSISQRDGGQKCPNCESTKVERLLSVFSAKQGMQSASAPPTCGDCQQRGVCPNAQF